MIIDSVPIYVIETAGEENSITDRTSFIITKKGFFRKTIHPLYNALHKIDELSMFAEVSEATVMSMDFDLPLGLLRQVTKFFEMVYEKHKSEANVILCFNSQTSEWMVLVPKQEVSGASVRYDLPSLIVPDGYVKMGTIHSHPSFGASQSSTDSRDEQTFDGLHITIGNVNTPNKTYHARYTFGGKNFVTDIINIISTEAYNEAVPNEWMDQISTYTYTYGYDRDGFGRSYNSNLSSRIGSRVKRLMEKDLKKLTDSELSEFVKEGLITA